jgi:AraC-like DNA-binding protein
MVLNRLVEKSFLVRHVRMYGVVQDERLTRSLLGVDSSHPRDTIAIVLHGQSHDEVGGRSFAVPSGHASLAPANSVSSSRSTNCEVLEIEWDPGTLGDGVGGAQVWSLGRSTLTAASRLGGLLEQRRTDAIPEAFETLLRTFLSEGLPVETEAPFTPSTPADQRLLCALDASLQSLAQAPMLVDIEQALGLSRRTLARRVSTLHKDYRLTGRGRTWRELRDRYRIVVATILLSHGDATVSRIASLVGYTSTEALHHAFREVGLPSPGAYRKALLRA